MTEKIGKEKNENIEITKPKVGESKVRERKWKGRIDKKKTVI